jgi:hypothetical protein
MEAASTSETLVNFYQSTRSDKPEDGPLYLLTDVRFEVLTALKMSVVIFGVVTSCGLLDRYHCFGETLTTTYDITRRRNPGDHNLY